MPRGSKKSANPHNSRHENGVVAPGKRIVKQRSNGLLNSSPDGRVHDKAPPVPSPAAPKHLNHAAGHGAAAPVRPNGTPASASIPTAGRSKDKLSRDEVVDDLAGTPDADGISDPLADGHLHRRADTHVARAYAGSMLSLPLTVLLSCPLRDTLAMLILLLSIPPVLVTATNSIFAVMTFVPPSGSFTVLPTLSDITSSFSPTTPSFVVTCIIDIVGMLLWLWIPFPALQAFFLDAAQAMVATTLGGGHSYRPDSKDNTLFSVSVVVATHMARYRSFLLKPVQHRIERWAPLIGEFDETYIENYPVGSDRSWWGTFKVFLALHIFCQGMTGMVRRRLHAPRLSSGSAAANKTVELDPAVGTSTSVDASRQIASAHTPHDLRQNPSLPNIRETNRDKISSGKRRRKQANYVRTQQPFWAAIAATKTTIMREYETNRANADASSARATNVENLGNAPYRSNEQTVWVTDVKETGFFFETGFLNTPRGYRPDEDSSDDSPRDEGIDRTLPLYVRCNKMEWVSMRMLPVPDSGDSYRQRWVGEVYGLSAGKTYHMSFVKSDDEETVLTQTVATPSASSNPVSATLTSTSFSPRPSSPASPTATLKSSISSYETRLSDLENAQRRQRKDHKAAMAHLHRDLDALTERLQSHSSTDDTLQNRVTHLTQHKRQLDDSVDAINTELEAPDVIPKEELDEYATRRASLDEARQRQSAAHTDVSELRKAHKAALDAQREQALNARHKTERLQARLRSGAARYAKLTEPLSTGSPGAVPRSNSDAANARAADRAALCARYEEDIAALSHDFELKTVRHNAMAAQVHALMQSMAQAEQAQALSLQQQQHHLYTNGPTAALSPQQAMHSSFPREPSRPGTPDYEMGGIVPGGIGTGFGYRSGSEGTGWYSNADQPAMSADLHSPFHLNGTSPIAHSARFPSGSMHVKSLGAPAAAISRHRSESDRSLDGGPFLHPDDDDLVPAKAKRRSIGYAAAFNSSLVNNGLGSAGFGGVGSFAGDSGAFGLGDVEVEADGMDKTSDASGSGIGSGSGSGSGSGTGSRSGSGLGSGSGFGSASGSGQDSPPPVA